MRSKRSTLVLLAAAFLSVWAAIPARANLLPYLASETAGTDGTTVFNYSVSLSSDERIDGTSGITAFFTIYDFAGYVAGSAFAPADWTVSVQDTGITPVGVIPMNDDPGIENLTFTYVGAATIVGTGQTFTGFGASSIYSDVSFMSSFSQQSTKNAGPAMGGRDYGGGPEDVPTAATPEPGTMLLLGSGLVGVGLMGRKLRRQRESNC